MMLIFVTYLSAIGEGNSEDVAVSPASREGEADRAVTHDFEQHLGED